MTTLAEALILLTDRGSSSSFSTVDRNTATVGATLVDLALAGRIDLSGKYVSVVDPAPTGNLLMDEVLA
ncbi:MAG: GPP34 family phosphoprotein, partial [Stackebrandtia sp.]